ncbi:dicer-like protein 4 [Carica papaya]|uniref:dicer-like protein 4 n=1 Tax=Carica papaya TaxID=3649 RepID=UPI000B8CB990|nr:dicer-like protein 4 [Carica papaya]
MPQSEYAFLVDSDNQKEVDLIENFQKGEERMNLEIVSRTSNDTFPRSDERIYRVESSGASISSGYSVSLLHQYCSQLPHDEYFHPKPKFYFFDDLGGTVCHVVLPSNAPINQIVGAPQFSMEAAKKDACLNAVEELHKLGVLSDFLLPKKKNIDEPSALVSSDSDSCEDEDSQGKLYEMLVPGIFREPWSTSENLVCLCSYYIKFVPDPNDRIYRKFGLFLKDPLPIEAERMELDLHLARRRSVLTTLIPAGVTEFDKDEILQAQHFQEMCFKVILDRKKLIPDFVPLESGSLSKSSFPSFYLLLPVIWLDDEHAMTIDWQTIRTCLSSPVFKTLANDIEKEILCSDVHLQLANGCWSTSDVEKQSSICHS